MKITASACSREHGSRRNFVEEPHASVGVESESESGDGEGEGFRELFVHEEDVGKSLLW